MPEKELDAEEQKRKARRKLLKLAAYSIPAVSSILAAGGANADEVDEYYDEFEADDEGDDDDGDDDHGETKRHRPNGRKKYKRGLS